jgi:hypothetical protein
MKPSRSLTACVPALDTCTQCPNPSAATDPSDATYSACSGLHLAPLVADLRSPADCYHSEAYLIGWLVKLYGWRVMEPGVLRRGWNGREVAANREAA